MKRRVVSRLLAVQLHCNRYCSFIALLTGLSNPSAPNWLAAAHVHVTATLIFNRMMGIVTMLYSIKTGPVNFFTLFVAARYRTRVSDVFSHHHIACRFVTIQASKLSHYF